MLATIFPDCTTNTPSKWLIVENLGGNQHGLIRWLSLSTLVLDHDLVTTQCYHSVSGFKANK